MQPVLVSRRLWWTLAATVFVVAIAASAIGIANGFTYDDQFVILHNRRIDFYPHWWRIFNSSYWPSELGGDGYRPLTIFLFAVEWAIGKGSPAVFHAANILLYSCLSVVVFWFTSMLLPVAYAACVAALFAAHPVHVEAVGNIVGQSEITVALLAVGAAGLYLRWRNEDMLDVKRMIVLGAMYFVACFAKEHAITIPALLMAVELFGVETRDPLVARLQRLRPFWLALAAVGLLFLWIRSKVLPGFTGFAVYVPFQSLHTGSVRRVLTMISLVPQWVRLLLWPAHLQTEYGPPQFPIADGLDIGQFPGFLLLGAILGMVIAAWKKAPAVSLGIVWLVIALLPSSNFLVPTGILLAERTLFLPSVGAMLAIGGLMPLVAQRLARPDRRVAAFAVVVCLIVAGVVRSAFRTRVWRDNETLFSAAVIDAPLSYRAHYILAGWRFDGKRLRDGEHEGLIALKLFPEEPFVTYNLGEEYRKAGMWEQAAAMFERSLAIVPNYKDALGRLAQCRAEQGEFPEARKAAVLAIQQGNSDVKLMLKILVAADDHAKGRDLPGSRVMPDTLQNPTHSALTGGG